MVLETMAGLWLARAIMVRKCANSKTGRGAPILLLKTAFWPYKSAQVDIPLPI